MEQVELIIHTSGQLVSCAGQPGPRRGAAMRELGVIAGGGVAVRGETIVAVGPRDELRRRYRAAAEVDAGGAAICPGLVDPHTHVVYAGDRVDEFERRIAGESYEQIMAAGGGIRSTMRAVRAADLGRLLDETRPRLDQMLRLGTTTAEAKSGYGLETAAELRQLEAAALLDASHPIDLVPTFLGAHVVPPEYEGHAGAYVDLVVGEMLPAAAAWYHGSPFVGAGAPMFADVFCERGAFDVAQSRRVLAAARALGLPLKAHVDEFSEIGGLQAALELGCVSVDHLDVTGPAGIAALAASSAIAVLIPAVTLNLGGQRYADGRAMIDAGVAVALTTDINPGSAPCPSLPLVMGLACRYQRLLPAEALLACTVNAAHAIGMGGRVGAIAPGMRADLLVLRSADYRHLAYELGGSPVAQVIKRGKLVYKDS